MNIYKHEKKTVEVGIVVQSHTFCVLVKSKCKSFPFHLLLFQYRAELLWQKRAAVKARKVEHHYIISLIIVLSVCLPQRLSFLRIETKWKFQLLSTTAQPDGRNKCPGFLVLFAVTL